VAVMDFLEPIDGRLDAGRPGLERDGSTCRAESRPWPSRSFPRFAPPSNRPGGVPVGNRYALSEATCARLCGQATQLPDDLCIFEPVDAAGTPVPPGVRSDKAWVTTSTTGSSR
jgi:hypothetical protein